MFLEEDPQLVEKLGEEIDALETAGRIMQRIKGVMRYHPCRSWWVCVDDAPYPRYIY